MYHFFVAVQLSMLSIGLIVLLSIDLVLLTYGKFRVYWVFIKKTYIAFKTNPPHVITKTDDTKNKDNISAENEIEEKVKSRFITWLKEAGLFVLKWILVLLIIAIILAFLLVILGFITSKIWVTILLAMHTNFVYAAVFLIAINLVFFSLGYGAHKAIKIDKSVTQRALIMDTMQFSMLAILLYFAAFGYPINVLDSIVIPFQWDIVLNNLISIVLPMLFFSLIIINILAVILRVRNMITKDRNKHKLIRLHQLLFIFIASCFFGILYLTDIDLSFMSDLERTMYLETLEVVKWIVTSAFIPLFIYTLNNFKKSKPIEKPKYRRRGRIY